MDWIVPAYWICLAVGIGYTIFAFVLGEVSSTVGGHDGGDFSHSYGVDGNSGHGEASGSDAGGGAVLFGPFSPLVIAFFLTSFGATGVLLTQVWNVHNVLTVPVAAVSGFLLAWALITFFNKVLGGMQSSSEVRLHSLVGAEAEVTVAIPATGMGEIAYVAMGTRCLTPARSQDQTPIPRFATVRIERIVGNIFHVRSVAADVADDVAPAAPAGSVHLDE